jgi:peptide/nickel transport system ATP-binding protein
MDPKAALRFLPSRLSAGQTDYIPQLNEIKPDHFVAEHDPLETIMANA